MHKKLVAACGLSAVISLVAPAHGQTTQSSVSPPWQFTDVGAVGTAGSAQQPSPFSGMTVSGAGSDIWGTADSFGFVHQPLRDGGVFASLSSESNTNPFAKAGVMIRQTLDPGSPEVILDVKPDGGVEFMTRTSQGGATTFIAAGSVAVTPGGTGVKMNVSLQLARLGSTVSAAYCDQTATNSPCVLIGQTSFPEGPALAGLAVTSHDPSVLNQAKFDTPPTVTSVPFPWATSDVGDVGTAGFATYEDATGSFFISGAGADIWGTSDAFHTVTQTLSGDSQLTTRVVSEQNTNAFAKAGLTIGDASPDAARVILDVKPDGGVEFMARSSAGAAMTFVAASSGSFPVWLRLTRTGDQFTGEISPDGQAWTTVGTVSVVMPASITGEFAVTSHDPATLNAAVFDNVGLTTGLVVGPVGPNLLVNPGFEDSIVPATGPGWVSDTPLRQTPAITETALPHSGAQNAACRTTSGDCGIYQETTSSLSATTGNLILNVYARADHPGALIGVNVDGKPGPSLRIAPGGYQPYTVGFFLGSFSSNPHPVIRVWMYAPPTAGVIAIDDVQLAENLGPR
jgi:hypothetical protein